MIELVHVTWCNGSPKISLFICSFLKMSIRVPYWALSFSHFMSKCISKTFSIVIFLNSPGKNPLIKIDFGAQADTERYNYLIRIRKLHFIQYYHWKFGSKGASIETQLISYWWYGDFWLRHHYHSLFFFCKIYFRQIFWARAPN